MKDEQHSFPQFILPCFTSAQTFRLPADTAKNQSQHDFFHFYKSTPLIRSCKSLLDEDDDEEDREDGVEYENPCSAANVRTHSNSHQDHLILHTCPSMASTCSSSGSQQQVSSRVHLVLENETELVLLED